MTKLRLVKGEEVEDFNIDQDPIIQNADPYGFMVVENTEPSLVKTVTEIFNLQYRIDGSRFILRCQPESDNYKVNILTLVAASLWLFNSNINQKVFIGVSQSLRGLLLQSHCSEKNLFKGEEIEQEGFRFKDSGLALTQQAQITLKQVGIDVLTNSKFLEMNSQQVRDLMKTFTAKDEKKLRLVG